MPKLNVRYFSQRDNFTQPWRTCFSSSVAMALKYIKPDSITNDDEYLRKVLAVGDTTEAWVHLEVLRSYGVKASFSTSCSNQTLKEYIDKGVPIPCGILHKGLAHSPTGGHWIIVIGYQDDPSAPDGGWWIVHDPWGEIDNPSGTYDSSGNQGRNEQYSYNLMNSRWTVEGANDGWSILIH
jgi:hypothetical protein